MNTGRAAMEDSTETQSGLRSRRGGGGDSSAGLGDGRRVLSADARDSRWREQDGAGEETSALFHRGSIDGAAGAVLGLGPVAGMAEDLSGHGSARASAKAGGSGDSDWQVGSGSDGKGRDDTGSGKSGDSASDDGTDGDDDFRAAFMRNSKSTLNLAEMEAERQLMRALHSHADTPPQGSRSAAPPKRLDLGRPAVGSAADGDAGGRGSMRDFARSRNSSGAGTRADTPGGGTAGDQSRSGSLALSSKYAAPATQRTARPLMLSPHGPTGIAVPEPTASPSRSRVLKPTIDLAGALPLMREGFGAVVEDSFTKCFISRPPDNWNWNVYLFPAWCIGVVARYFVLFPLRLTAFIVGWLVFFLASLVVHLMYRGDAPKTVRARRRVQQKLVQMICSVFVISWSGVIRFHRQRPEPLPGKTPGVFVANHSSMIDFIILQASHCYAVVGQKHGGWVGWCQDHILGCLDCVWFDRGETKNRAATAAKLRDHVQDPERTPLLVFPEGTCVNNRYVMQFKKGVFDLDVAINPVAIRYNSIFVDGYWNSRAQSFQRHLFTLMTSWCVVADVWFLEPQVRAKGETSVEFAGRVQRKIADVAGLKAVDWDGYMKYWAPSRRFIRARQKAFADTLYTALPAADDLAADIPSVPLRRTVSAHPKIGRRKLRQANI